MRNISTKFILVFLLSVVVSNLTARAQKAELVVQTGHSEAVTSIAVSSDGKIFASGSPDNTIKLWDLTTQKELKTLFGHFGIYLVTFSPDSRKLASASVSGSILIWDVNSGQKLLEFEGHSDAVTSIVFSLDGRTLVSCGGGDETIKLWDVSTGQLLTTLEGSPIGFLNDTTFIALNFTFDRSNTNLSFWDTTTGRLLKKLPRSYENSLFPCEIFSKGKILACTGSDNSIQLQEVETGRVIKTLNGNTNQIVSLTFSQNGKILASSYEDKTIKLWAIQTGEVRNLRGHNEVVWSMAFSSDGNTLISGSRDKTIKLWNVVTGQLKKTFHGNTSGISAIAISPDNKTLVLGSGNEGYTSKEFKIGNEGKKIKFWDLTSNQIFTTLEGHDHNIFSIEISPDEKIIASGSYDNTIKIWDIVTKRELRTLIGHKHFVLSVSFSPDSKSLASASGDNTIVLWDIDTGQKLKTLTGHSEAVRTVTFSPSGKLLASGSYDKTIKLWDVSSGQELRTFYGHAGPVLLLAFSPNDKLLASYSEGSAVKIWDVVAGKELKTLNPYPLASYLSEILAIVPSYFRRLPQPTLMNDRFRLFINSSGRLDLYEFKSQILLASLFPLKETDWAVVTPDGLFDASPDARKLMHYVVGLEPITLEQMKDVYYVPGLLQKIFKGEPLPEVELFSKQDLFPQVEYDPLKPHQKQLTIKLTNRGGGIGQVQVLFNGKELIADARPTGFNSNSPNTALTIDLSQAPVKKGEENRIEIVARNAAGSLSTRGTSEAENVYKDESNNPIEPPNIYAIVGGISNYTGDNLRLNFAAKDAEDFAHALELGATKLLNGDKSKVHIRLLTSNSYKSGVKFNAPDAKISTATKADFAQAFADFRNATSKDVFIVYLAGHGISLNLNQNPAQAGGDTYLYLTQEATTTDKSVLTVEASRKAMTISSEELKDLMKQNKALKQVLILDTCAAGALSNSLVGKRDLPSDQIRAIERLKDSTGFFVLMGSAADAASYEASQYGQGLLTYSLLQGMKGARLRENQFADVGLLFGYAQDTVPQMAKNIGGIQRPLIITPDTSNSFDIGKFTTEEQKLISLSAPKPLILRPNLRNSAMRFDNLKLTQMMTEQLRQASYLQSRGEPSQIVFVEANEMTDAVQPVGDYAIEGDTLKISMILVKNNAPVGKEITVSGKTSEPEQVIKQLVETVMRSLQ